MAGGQPGPQWALSKTARCRPQPKERAVILPVVLRRGSVVTELERRGPWVRVALGWLLASKLRETAPAADAGARADPAVPDGRRGSGSSGWSSGDSGGGGGYHGKAEKEAKLKREREFFESLVGLPPHVQRARIREVHWQNKTVHSVDSLPCWADYTSTQPRAGPIYAGDPLDPINVTPAEVAPRFRCSPEQNGVVTLWKGDITALEADGIVNAANARLSDGGGVCGAIHAAAGPLLKAECRQHTAGGRLRLTGSTVVTKGYRLPAPHVLHTVGPQDQDHKALASCYRSVLDQAAQQGMRSVAFCCVSTGIYDFPLLPATHRALCTVRKWLDKNKDKVQRVVFCVFQAHELAVYERLLPSYFPRESDPQLGDGALPPPVPGDDGTTPPDSGAAAAGDGAAAGPEEPLTTPYVPGLCGLWNLGNTCFMNSGVQCLSHCPELREYFLSKQYLRHVNRANILGTKGRLADAFAKLMARMWSGGEDKVAPQELKAAIEILQPRFHGGGQHDSQELVGYLLDGLHEDTNRVTHKRYVKAPDDAPPQGAAKRHAFERKRAADAWDRHFGRNDSRINDLFMGLLRSNLRCNKCERKGVQFDPAMHIQVPVKGPKQGKGACSEQPLDLEQCLMYHNGEEQLDERNGWYCPSCKKPVMAYKELSLWMPPTHLIVQLKRFVFIRSSSDPNGVRRKICTPVKFPLEGLDIAPLLASASPWCKLGQSRRLLYDLYAVSNHLSSGTAGGHYTAFCKNNRTRQWHCFNDDRVTEIDSDTVAGNNVDAYLLFYRLRENLDGRSSPSEGGEIVSTESESSG